MKFDLNDPRSILAWWRVWPERHSLALQAMSDWHPEFRKPIMEAWRLIDEVSGAQ